MSVCLIANWRLAMEAIRYAMQEAGFARVEAGRALGLHEDGGMTRNTYVIMSGIGACTCTWLLQVESAVTAGFEKRNLRLN